MGNSAVARNEVVTEGVVARASENRAGNYVRQGVHTYAVTLSTDVCCWR